MSNHQTEHFEESKREAMEEPEGVQQEVLIKEALKFHRNLGLQLNHLYKQIMKDDPLRELFHDKRRK